VVIFSLLKAQHASLSVEEQERVTALRISLRDKRLQSKEKKKNQALEKVSRAKGHFVVDLAYEVPKPTNPWPTELSPLTSHQDKMALKGTKSIATQVLTLYGTNLKSEYPFEAHTFLCLSTTTLNLTICLMEP